MMSSHIKLKLSNFLNHSDSQCYSIFNILKSKFQFIKILRQFKENPSNQNHIFLTGSSLKKIEVFRFFFVFKHHNKQT